MIRNHKKKDLVMDHMLEYMSWFNFILGLNFIFFVCRYGNV